MSYVLKVAEFYVINHRLLNLHSQTLFPNVIRIIDRFHIQKLACDALQEMRIAHRWDAIQAETDAVEEA